MKRYCKNADITDIKFLEFCAKECLKAKWKRRDVTDFFCKLLNTDSAEIAELIKTNKPLLISKAAEYMQESLVSQKLDLVPIWYKEKIDSSSGKLRVIGIQNITQQLFDYVAVYGMQDLFRRIGEYQCASIPLRGTLYGMKQIRRWLKEKDIKYYAKLDIQKCFPSIPQDKLLAYIDKYVANDRIKWLVHELVGTFDKGLAIGSFLSQYLCNLYLSILYHEIAENMYYVRRGKRINLVKHQLFYMDDIHLFGTSAKALHKAVKFVIAKAKGMGLTVKAKWIVSKLTGFIDSMGFRIYADHVTIRRRIFIRIRRAYKRARDSLNPVYAHKCISYAGFLFNTDSYKFIRKYKVYKILRKAKEVIRNESKLRQRTVESQVACC